MESITSPTSKKNSSTIKAEEDETLNEKDTPKSNLGETISKKKDSLCKKKKKKKIKIIKII